MDSTDHTRATGPNGTASDPTGEVQKWLIGVGGYGCFVFEGTEQQAEEMRRHKARWEGGPGHRCLASDRAACEQMLDQHEYVEPWRSALLEELGHAEREADDG